MGILDIYNKTFGNPEVRTGLLSMGSNLLATNKPSRNPQTLSSNLGQSIGAYQQGAGNYRAEQMAKEQQAMNKKLMEARIANMGQKGNKIGAINPGLYTPESMQAFQMSVQSGQPNYDLLEFKPEAIGSSTLAEMNHIQSLPPEQRGPAMERMLQLKRSNQMVGKELVSPTGKQVIGPERIGATTAAAADVVAKGKDTTEAQISLPEVESNSDYLTGIIDSMLDHPGLSGSVGVKSIGKYAPGTKEADFGVLLDQVQGKVFMQAYQSLKGGGQITEIESEKATAALARLNTAQSEESFRQAAQDFKKEVKRLTDLVRQRAGQNVNQNDDPLGILY